MKIAILGFGDQGRSAYEYWDSPENQITICDSDTSLVAPQSASTKLGDDYLNGLEEFDVIVRSPSVHPKDIELASPGIYSKVTSVTNEFLRVCPTKNIVGVTGTKGKGTTSTLITKMLEASGKKVHLGGNIGTPPLEMLKENIQPDDWVVLELANFQLIDLKYSPYIGVCLMIASEHQDWHKDFAEYVESKKQLFRWQKESDKAIYFSEDQESKDIVQISAGIKIPYFSTPGAFVDNDKIVIDTQTIIEVSQIKLLGKHNWQNICAAITAVWQITQDVPAIQSVITTFGGMEHRLELVREINGVKYYNDSLGTTPETAIVAIEAFNQPKVLILGGSDKGADFAKLGQVIAKSNVRHAIIIGVTSTKIAEAINKADPDVSYEIHQSITMQDIVNLAKSKAHTGDIVLLSTGCASFDLFKNYKDRGEQFKSVVNSL